MPNRMLKNRAFINTLVLIVIAVIILGYLKVDLRTLVSSPQVQANLAYTGEVIVSGAKNLFTTAYKYLIDILGEAMTKIKF
jgi:hypothetical protein